MSSVTTAPTVTPFSPAKSKPKQKPKPKPSFSLSQCISLQQVQQVHAFSIKTDPHNDPADLIVALSSLSPPPLSYARQLLDRAPHPTPLLFNVLLRAHSRSLSPLADAFSLFSLMLRSAVPPDAYTFPSLLKSCARAAPHHPLAARQAHAAALKLSLADHPFVLPTLIHMYAELRDLPSARSLFPPDCSCVVSYNAMLAAFVRSSRPGEALSLFRELQARGLAPTDVTILSVLSACALLGALELGRWVHGYVRANGFASRVKVGTALIDMYAKCGSLEDAVGVFRSMGSRDTQAWSAMIVAYALHGRGAEAISLFEEMLRDRVEPDGITFLGVLYACSHSGMVDQGLDYFRSMKSRRYRLVPGVKHYGCVVDLLARAGRLDEAYKFIDSLPIEPTPVLWRTLLSACGGHGNAGLGKVVFERILELDDTHGGDYVMLSNMCASEGRWDDVDRVRRLMHERRAVKVPGVSSIELGDAVHEFFSGDGRHPMSREAHRMVDGVVEQLKGVGYVPDTSRVAHAGMDEEEKEISLRYHSEKLAIGFGLIGSPPGTTLRVVKNLRVCGDCHSMAKMVSMVFGRRIVLRDLNRFHHFENGSCSCGDYY